MDKDLIIDAAFKLIIEYGLEGFSIAKLAHELNCTKSSIYNYFKSKDDLLNQIFIQKTKLLTYNINMDTEAESVIRQYAHNCINNRDVFGFFHKYSHSNFINKETMSEVKKELKLGFDITQKLIASLEYKDINPIIIEVLIFGPIHGLVMRHQRNSDLQVTEKDVDDLVDFILSTIRKEKYESNS